MKTSPSDQSKETLLAENRQAYHQYEILEKITAGLVLSGPEVKSARAKHLNLKSAYASIENGQALLKNLHISAYQAAPDPHYNPERVRHLLLHKKEIFYLDNQLSQKGLTLIPLQAHLTRGKIKIVLGLCRGKKLYDKRQDLKKKVQNLEIKRSLKRY